MTLIREWSANALSASSDAEVGVEVEWENNDDESTLSRNLVRTNWRLELDNSLRNGGIETISPPMPADMLDSEIDTLYTAVAGSPVRGSIRTGTHVHVNCLGYTPAQVQAIATTYALVEPALYAFCGAVREEGIYCIPWYRTNDQPRLARLMGSYEGFRQATRSACKYSGLFLAPLYNYGTIEFRMAPTFNSPVSLKKWVRLVLKVRDYGVRLRTATAVMEDYYTVDSAEHFCQQVFGGMYADLVRSNGGLLGPLLEDKDAEACAETVALPEEALDATVSW